MEQGPASPAGEEKRLPREPIGDERQADLEIKTALHDLEMLLRAARQNGALLLAAERICREISRMFGVRDHEVALLNIEGRFLKFVYPRDLTQVGSIPLSSSAVAARTAASRKAERFNSFPKVKHLWLFEVARGSHRNESTHQQEGRVIQKLMSAPVLGEHGDVIAVVQVSRKGFEASNAGPDFTQQDLRKLECAAEIIGKMIASAEIAKSGEDRS
jgi:hypothetical protein